LKNLRPASEIALAHCFVTRNAPKIKALAAEILGGDKSTFEKYEALVGPVQAE
jgi:hypothetical protein